jgi:hypothetical protein
LPSAGENDIFLNRLRRRSVRGKFASDVVNIAAILLPAIRPSNLRNSARMTAGQFRRNNRQATFDFRPRRSACAARVDLAVETHERGIELRRGQLKVVFRREAERGRHHTSVVANMKRSIAFLPI